MLETSFGFNNIIVKKNCVKLCKQKIKKTAGYINDFTKELWVNGQFARIAYFICLFQ